MKRDRAQEVERKLTDLASDSPTLFEAAQTWFIERGREILPALAEGLDDELLGSVGHMRILQLLRHFARRETLPAVLKAFRRALRRQDPVVLPAAMEALAVFEAPEAVDALLSLLDHHDHDVVKYAAVLAGRAGGMRAADPLLTLLESTDPSIRYSAAMGLIELDDASVRSALERHVEVETNAEVRALLRGAIER
jgi:HEAT repeat protein